ncbi:MAG: leucine-rich repeat domain-containing protein [Bacteroidales bacterium]|nr:leucine-rich repeat domain-containing protein [Candidatus Physcousia equi]
MKKTFLTLMMGATLLTSCGGEKKADTKNESAETETTEKTEAKTVAEKPADLHVYKSSEITAKMKNEYKNVGFDQNVLSTLDNMMEGNTAVEALYFDHKINMIGTASFKDCTNLKQVYFDDIVEVIGDEAFAGCKSLESISASTSTYGLNAFDGCTSLKVAKMDDRGWKIREGALANCTALKTVIIPMTIDAIEEGAFKGSTGIEELTIPYNFKDRMYTFCADAKNVKKLFILTPAWYAFPTTAAAKAFNKKQCEVYVPDAQIEDFKKDPSWSDFAAIKKLSESGYFNADCTIK